MSKTNAKTTKKSQKAGTKNASRRAAAKAVATTLDIPPTVEIITGQSLPKRAAKPKAEPKPRRVSALDAAADVLRKADRAMASKDLIAAMAEQGLWQSPNGKTPHATLYAAILREITAKGDAAQFRKVDRGQFVYNG